MRTPLALLVCCAALAAPARGQQEALEVLVEPDGRGRLALDRRVDASAQLDGLRGADRRAGADEEAARWLAAWRGVAAWDPVQVDLEGDELRVRATGWFEDLARVGEDGGEEAGELRWTWRREGDELEVEQTLAGSSVPRSLAEMLDHGPDELEAGRAAVAALFAPRLAGLRLERTLVLPGAARLVLGATVRTGPGTGAPAPRVTLPRVDGRRVTIVETGAEALAAMERMFDALIDAARRLQQGELARDQAIAAVASALPPPRRVTARCTLDPALSDAAAVASFSRGRDAALATWASSPWRGRLSLAAATPAEGQEEERAPEAPARSDVAPDRFEPNDEPAAAKPLQRGGWSGMKLRGEDWYRVDVPAGQAVTVALLTLDNDPDLDLELRGPDGAVWRRSAGVGRRERARVLRTGGGPVLVRVLGGDAQAQGARYRLDVSFAAAAKDDALDPNAPPDPPAALAPGTHGDLVVTDEDRYRVVGKPGERLRVTLAPGEEATGLAVELRDPTSGAALAEAEGTGSAACLVPAGGVVHVVVLGDGPYGLVVSLRPPQAPDRLEPNDSAAKARGLRPGTQADLRLDGDDDWFSVDVPAGHELRVAATFDRTQGDLDLSLHEPDGRPLRAAAGLGGEERLGLLHARGGKLLVRVHGAAAGLTYSLAVEVKPAPPADRFEPNETLDEAKPLAPGDHADLRCTLEDWYRVELKRGQTLVVEVRARLADGDLDLELLGPDRARAAASAGPDDLEAARFTAAADGPCWVRVHGAEAPYRLLVRLE